MKTIILKKDTMKKTLIICCLLTIWFMSCTSAPVGNIETIDQNLNKDFLGEIYIDKMERFSIIIPKGWEIRNESNSVVYFTGLMAEYNLTSTSSLALLNLTSLSVSKYVDGMVQRFTANNEPGLHFLDPQKGSINIVTKDLQVNQKGNIDITTADLQVEYIKVFATDKEGKISWMKVYCIPHLYENTIMMINCVTLLTDNNIDLDIVFDKFVKTFNWIR